MVMGSGQEGAGWGAARRAKTREALLGAGLRLLADQPIDAIAIDSIVRAAGVAKGSFFNHFDDKDAFAKAIARHLRAEIEAAVGELNRGIDDPARRVARAVSLFVRYAAAAPRRASALMRVSSHLAQTDAPLNRGVLDDVSAGLARGRFDLPSPEPGVLAVLGVAQIALARVVGEPSIAARLGAELCAVLLRGLGLPPVEARVISAAAAREIIGEPV